jgi:2-aminoethylphosphonate-pyruvate transaminase
VPPNGKVLVVNNGAYGARLAEICRRLRIDVLELRQPEIEPADPATVKDALDKDSGITHVALVHCETTTGMLNPVEEIGRIVRERSRSFIVDAMSSFGGIPLSMRSLSADYLISSANKCIQGVPGFGFVIANRVLLSQTSGWARSLSLDLHGQWKEMETKGGKWRYTSPTHVVRAFSQALDELDQEGGIPARHARYQANHSVAVEGLRGGGFQTLLPDVYQSPIITSFVFPDDSRFNFNGLYEGLKQRRFVIYPGKVSQAETFRVGHIGHVFPDDMRELARCFHEVVRENGWRMERTAE